MLLYFSPDIETHESLCPFMRFFYFPCPGCGLTKSLYYIAKGDIESSFSYHPFGIVVEIFAIVILILSFLDYRRNKTYVDHFLNLIIMWKALALIFIIFYVSRVLYYILSGEYWF